MRGTAKRAFLASARWARAKTLKIGRRARAKTSGKRVKAGERIAIAGEKARRRAVSAGERLALARKRAWVALTGKRVTAKAALRQRLMDHVLEKQKLRQLPFEQQAEIARLYSAAQEEILAKWRSERVVPIRNRVTNVSFEKIMNRKLGIYANKEIGSEMWHIAGRGFSERFSELVEKKRNKEIGSEDFNSKIKKLRVSTVAEIKKILDAHPKAVKKLGIKFPEEIIFLEAASVDITASIGSAAERAYHTVLMRAGLL